MPQRFVYRILNKNTNKIEGSYERCNYMKYDFDSEEQARDSNCHGMYADKERYDVIKIKVTEEVV